MKRSFSQAFFVILLVISASLSVSAQSVAIVHDFGAVSDDDIDDTQAIQAAIDHVLQRGGGSVLFGAGTYLVSGRLNVVPDEIGIDVSFKGEGTSAIQIGAGDGVRVFYAGNLNQLNFMDLTFFGRNVMSGHPEFIDAGYLIFADNVLAFNMIRCNFFGIATRDSSTGRGAIVYLGATEGVIRDTNFNGSYAPYPDGSLIEARNSRGLIVANTRFIDYANYRGEYFSKTTAFVGAWIRALNTENFDSSQGKGLVVEDSFFDEGAAVGIDAIGIPTVKIGGLRINVNGTSPGRGIRLNKVKYAEVTRSVFGMASYPRPAIETVQAEGLKISGLRFSEEVYFLMNNGLQSASVEFCPQCGVIVQSPRRPPKVDSTFK